MFSVYSERLWGISRADLISISNMGVDFNQIRYGYRLKSRWLALGTREKTISDTGAVNVHVELGKENKKLPKEQPSFSKAPWKAAGTD